jgi:hypothetical protein
VTGILGKLAVLMTAPPVTFFLLQATPADIAWKPIFDTGVIGSVCLASFWLIRYLLEQLRIQSDDNEKRIDTMVLQHREDMKNLMIKMDLSIQESIKTRGEDRLVLQNLVSNCADRRSSVAEQRGRDMSEQADRKREHP